jgi:hypothetical protein
MKYYVRYFENEALVNDLKEAQEFLINLPGVEIDDSGLEQLTTYFSTDQKGSKKIFMPNHRSFLVIKTTVDTLEEFKANNQKNLEGGEEKVSTPKSLDIEQEGWYECRLSFQRIVANPDTKKCFYYNDALEARVKAKTGREAYDRMVEHIRKNPDVDERSQMPAAASKNFTWKYLGETC